MRRVQERRAPCQCGGYWFPHRYTSGTCAANPHAARLQFEKLTGLSFDSGLPLPGARIAYRRS